MKRYLLLFIAFNFFTSNFSYSAPPWMWAKKAGDMGYDMDSERGCIATTPNGDSYVTGVFKGKIKFGTIVLTAADYSEQTDPNDLFNDVFVAKIDKNGNWLWAVSAGGMKEDYATGIIHDEMGNIYVTGIFTGECSFGQTKLTAGGAWDIFLSKLTPGGSWDWTIQAGGTMGYETINSWDLGCDLQGNIFVWGDFTNPLKVKFGNIELIEPTGVGNFFLAKANNGSWNFATYIDTKGIDQPNINISRAIAVDDNGNCYVTGIFFKQLTIGTKVLSALSDNFSIFVAKFTSGNSWDWATNCGNAVQTSACFSEDIEVDKNGNVYLNGYFRKEIEFKPGLKLTSQSLSDFSPNGFIAKLNSLGEWQWASMAGTQGSAITENLVLDNSGNPYICGGTNRDIHFGTITLPVEEQTGFIASIDQNGNWQWAVPGGEGMNSLSIDAVSSLYCSKFYQGDISFGSHPLPGSYDKDSVLVNDFFVAKLQQVMDVTQEVAEQDYFQITPNPADNYILISNMKAEVHDVVIYNYRGIEVLKIKSLTNYIDLRNLPQGLYYIKFTEYGVTRLEKFLILRQ